MATQIHVPSWAQEDPAKLLKFLSQYGALQFSHSGSVKTWCDFCGISDRVVQESVRRGYFTRKTALLLIAALAEGAMHAYWLINPSEFLNTEILVYGD